MSSNSIKLVLCLGFTLGFASYSHACPPDAFDGESGNKVLIKTKDFTAIEVGRKGKAEPPLLEEWSAPIIPLQVKLDPKTKNYSGLTTEGLATLSSMHKTINQRYSVWNSRILGNARTFWVTHASMLAGKNVLFHGPGGAAKTLATQFFIDGEAEKSFKLVMNEMTPESAIIGGQTFKSAQEGVYFVNTASSAGRYTLAVIDESGRSNPAVLVALFSYLNPAERELAHGTHTYKTRTQYVLATTNESLADLRAKFQRTEQLPALEPYLRRYANVIYMHGWLARQDRLTLNGLRMDRQNTRGLSLSNPDLLNTNKLFLNPEPVLLQELRQIASQLIVFRDPDTDTAKPSLFETTLEELLDNLIHITKEEEKKSLQQSRDTRTDVGYVPTFQFNEAKRGDIYDHIRMSVFLELLASSLMDTPEKIKALTAKPIVLDMLSLWRGIEVVGTTIPGDLRLELTTDRSNPLKLQSTWNFNPDRDSVGDEAVNIANIMAERARYMNALNSLIAGNKEAMEIVAEHSLSKTKSGKKGVADPTMQSIELRLAAERE